MRSITKRDLSRAEIDSLLRRALGASVELRDVVEFTDGWFNTTYGVTLVDDREVVVKVAPPPGLSLLRYEVDLMRTEIEFYRRAASAGLPLPVLRHADPDAGYLVMDRLRGQSLETAKQAMSPAQLAAVRHQVGVWAARLNTVTGARFGYPRRDGRTRSASWRASFLAIMDDILADAVAYDRRLPASATTVSRLVRRHAGLLDEVTRPALVHFDLWDGNIFVRPDGDGFAVEGIIDGERAFYGDPLAELVSLAVFADPAEVPGLLPGYLGRDELTEPERNRLRLYQIYLYLILLTEDATRDYPAQEYEPVRQLAMTHLEAALARL
ncbi:phosphotransferase family protein [Micromonospora sp. KC723]|uniref:phosphotransferase family protein n=1 Tax=Micromonospora sp. KC723 TaxID=2530381 RepID=UPI001404418D|nr:aminoglycoside phosphotransferase family protein [Micromonospora sp. KC723]